LKKAVFPLPMRPMRNVRLPYFIFTSSIYSLNYYYYFYYYISESYY
jgi:hypothetical protein